MEELTQSLNLTQLYELRALVDKRIKNIEQLRKQEARNKVDEKFYSNLFQKTLTLLNSKEKLSTLKALRHTYVDLPFEIRWEMVSLEIPEYGCTPKCCANECWYRGNRDRLNEYDGTSFELIIDRSVNFCDICVQDADMCDEEYDAMNDCLDCDTINKFEQWYINHMKSQPNHQRFIKMFDMSQSCDVCNESDEDFEICFYYDCNTKKIVCSDCVNKIQ